MSYLSSLRIQCSMGNDESKIINYVIFGKREELTQFPETKPVTVLTGEEERTQFRPIYLFWDKTDETLVQFYEQWRAAGKTGWTASFGNGLCALAQRHIRNKYKEVFLCDPETLFLSERAEKEIPIDFWIEKPPIHRAIFGAYGKETARKILGNASGKMTLFLVLNEECYYEEEQTWLFQAEREAKETLRDLFLIGGKEQKEKCEEILELFYMETGLAGSFYPLAEYKRILSETEGDVLLLDCLGLSVSEIGRPTFYIDGAGVRTEKEIRRLAGVFKACHGLRNHLDRAFLSAL